MGLKLCITCHKSKPFSEFHYKNKSRGTRQDRCIECAKEYAKLHYEKNKEKRLEQINERQNHVRAENRKLYASFISSAICSVCGEKDGRCLTSNIHNDDVIYKSQLILEDLIKIATVKCLNCDAKEPMARACLV